MTRIWPLLCVAAMVASDAAPGEPMKSAVLHTHCRVYFDMPGSPGALACEAFVQGYLEGLRSEARIESVDRDRSSEWTDRAARTRLGRAQLQRLEKPENYCVPEEATLATVIRQLVDHLEANPDLENAPAADALAETLRRHHSCT